MAIIISKNGKNAKKVEKSDFEKEDCLQKYIYDNPESIPLYDIKEDIRLLILSREFSTNSGPIDALGIDKEGEIYLVETKLYKNPDKRLVVAQVLDYGASLWHSYNNFDEFIRVIDNEVNNKFGVRFNQRVKNFFGIGDEEISVLIENLKKNLNEGNFKFVVLMDKLRSQLKDLIVFINENSRFDIFAVEMEYYKHEDYEIMIPKLFGAEVKKDIGVSSSSARGEWNKERFFQSLEQNLEKSQAEKMKEIYKNFEKISDRIKWGTGTSVGSYAPIINNICPNRSLLSVFSNGKLSIKFSWFHNDENEKEAGNKFKKLLSKYATGLEIPEDYKNLEVRFELKEWLPYENGILKSFEELKS